MYTPEEDLRQRDKLTKEASAFYIAKINRMSAASDFIEDNSCHGVPDDLHIMYKYRTLKSRDGHRGYQIG